MVLYTGNNVYVLMACTGWSTTAETLFSKSYTLDSIANGDIQTCSGWAYLTNRYIILN